MKGSDKKSEKGLQLKKVTNLFLILAEKTGLEPASP